MADKLKIALVGTGAMGRRHVDAMTAIDEVEVTALMDVSEENMKARVDEFCAPRGANPKLYTNYDDLLDKEELDGVVFSTPHSLHFPQAMQALDKGLHILMEKPMVTSTEHAQELCKKVEETGKVFLIAFPGACSNEHRYIRALRESGELGEIKTIKATVAQGWCQGREDLWRLQPEISGGGQLYDSGSHVINGVLWLCDQEPVEVYADVNNRGYKVDITSAVIIKFANGAMANLTILGDSAGPFEHSIEMYTDKNTIHVGVFGQPFAMWGPDRKKVENPPLGETPLTTDINFVNAVLGKDEVLCGPKFGLRLAKLMDSIYESGKQRAPIKIG
jgi:predicted dehydrogenase